MNKKGILITFEGTEGSGKSTQIKLLFDFLKRKGLPVFLTREPGGTRVSDEIRKVLLDAKNKEMTSVCETLLYMASRAQLVEEVIKPELRQGKIVLCDRWLGATVAYQGYAGGVDIRWIKSLGKTATDAISPALTLFLDLPLLTGLKRAKKRNAADRMEKKTTLFHKKVREGYLSIARKEPKRFVRILVKENDGVFQVHEKIKKIILDALCTRRFPA